MVPFADDARIAGPLRFFEDACDKLTSSSVEVIGVDISAISGSGSRRSWLSIDLLQGRGEPAAVTGEGRGVMSIIGPKPGEDTAEAGEREPPVKCDADSVDLTLELR